MAICDWMKYVTILLTFLVCSCISEELDNVNNVNNEGHIWHLLNKRSAEHQHGQFWKRDTEKSSFWKRDVDEALPALLEARAEEEKRRAHFLGKRVRSQFLGKREDGYSDDEYVADALEDEAEKRSRMNFLGKRGNRQAFLGKRPRQAFLGKRTRLSFLGKRADGLDGLSEAEVQDYLEQLDYDKRRSQFLGKRGGRVAFLGKKDNSDSILNYRIAYDLRRRSRSYPRKRPRLAFLGKRAYDDMDDDKRARVAFLGKRSAEVVGEANSE